MMSLRLSSASLSLYPASMLAPFVSSSEPTFAWNTFGLLRSEAPTSSKAIRSLWPLELWLLEFVSPVLRPEASAAFRSLLLAVELLTVSSRISSIRYDVLDRIELASCAPGGCSEARSLLAGCGNWMQGSCDLTRLPPDSSRQGPAVELTSHARPPGSRGRPTCRRLSPCWLRSCCSAAWTHRLVPGAAGPRLAPR